MKTYYFTELKSGNFKVATAENHTHKTTDLHSFYWMVARRKSTTWSRSQRTFKQAQIIKATYSQSQTYFTSAEELQKHLN